MTPAAEHALQLETLAAQLAAAKVKKQAASDAAEAKVAEAERDQEVCTTPSRTRSRATQGAKALEVAHLHVSILHQKLEAESRLHGPQSPQKQAAQRAHQRAEQKIDTIEREADWAAAEEAEAEALAAKASTQRAAAARALRRAVDVARQQAEAAASAAAEAAAAAAAAAKEAVEKARQEAAAKRAVRDAEEARAATAAAAAAPTARATDGASEVAVPRAVPAAVTGVHAAVESCCARSPELARAGVEESSEQREIVELQQTFAKIMRDKAEAEKLVGKGRRLSRRKA